MINAAANPIEGLVLLDLITGIAVLVALARIWTTPSWMWARGGWSKLGWATTAIWLTVTFGHVAWPVGAVLALRHVQRLRRQPLPAPGPLPFATGQTDPAWWNVEQADPDNTGRASQETTCEADQPDRNPIVALWEEGTGPTTDRQATDGHRASRDGLPLTGTDDGSSGGQP